MAITKDNKIEASDMSSVINGMSVSEQSITYTKVDGSTGELVLPSYVRTIDHHEAVDNNVTVLDTYNVTNPVTPGSDTVEDWQALGSGTYWFNNNNTNTGYPESQYGFIINIRGDTHSDIFQIWKPQRDQKPYYRGGNASGWSSWNMFGGTASLVATYSSGTSWYRKWSDGWIEQGGLSPYANDTTTTVNLNHAFSNTNYTVVTSPVATVAMPHTRVVSKATASFVIGHWVKETTQNYQSLWYACGF